MTLQKRVPLFEQGDLTLGDSVIHWEVSKFHDCGSTSSCALVFFKGDKIPKLQNVIPSLSTVIASALSMRYFYSQSVINQFDIGTLMFGKDLPTTPVPCRYISSLGADAWDVAVCLISI